MARVDRSLPTKAIDTLVIGAGVGGLACAARLARRGQHVLVLDQHFLPGGYCTSFHRQGYTLDACIDTLCGAAPGREGRNLDHYCVTVDPFDADAIFAHLDRHGVEHGAVESRYGAEGDGPSIYVTDPEGNVVELKGPPYSPQSGADGGSAAP